jgi:hypothetical protein
MGTPHASPGDPDNAGRWPPVAIGRPVASFAPRPPALEHHRLDTIHYRPDTICDAWSTEHFTVRLASVRGYAHRYDGTPRQDDAVAVEHPITGTVVFAVADGVSAAEQSHIGSTLACHASIAAVLDALDGDPGRIDWEQVVRAAADRLVGHARDVLGPAAADPVRAGELLATTLVVGIVCPARNAPNQAVATMVQVGDTSAWLLRDRSFLHLFGPSGDDDPDVLSTAVIPLPRTSGMVGPRDVTLPRDGVLLVGTDGFGGPLGDGSGQVGQKFADTFANALADPPTALELAHTLDFSRETFDDDRALVAIWPTGEPGNAPGTR